MFEYDQHLQNCTNNLLCFYKLLRRMTVALFSFLGGSLLTFTLLGFSPVSFSISALLLVAILRVLRYYVTGAKDC